MKTLILATLLVLTMPALASPKTDPSNPLNYAADQSVPPVATNTPLAKNHPHPPTHRSKQAASERVKAAPKKVKPATKAVKCRDGSRQHLRINCAPHGGIAHS